MKKPYQIIRCDLSLYEWIRKRVVAEDEVRREMQKRLPHYPLFESFQEATEYISQKIIKLEEEELKKNEQTR